MDREELTEIEKKIAMYYDGYTPLGVDRPKTLADIEFDKELDEYLAAQQEKYRKAKEEKKAESENRGNNVRK